ncbi:CopG family transcriptional regulator, partial [Mesorhizobium sp. WSM4935]|nr:CopG family transcriptional regulator [Mesorhizobium sp. WSM4935]
LAAIDTEASRRGLTRSAFIASAAREKIEGQRKPSGDVHPVLP